MIKQWARTFYRDYGGDDRVDDQVNEWMEQHPNYRIIFIKYIKHMDKVKEAVFVVFETEVVD